MIPQEHPMALLNQGKEHLINYSGNTNKRISEGGVDYYYGNITVVVTGNFESLNIECNRHGSMGGENLLKYSDTCT